MRPFVARAVAVVPCVFVGDFGAAGGVAAATEEAGRVGSCAVVLSLGEPVVPLVGLSGGADRVFAFGGRSGLGVVPPVSSSGLGAVLFTGD